MEFSSVNVYITMNIYLIFTLTKFNLISHFYQYITYLYSEYQYCCNIPTLFSCFIFKTAKIVTQFLPPISCVQGAEHCSSLNFGLGCSDPVLGISGSELEAGVEYTFRLTISKDGMAPESTTQTVSAHILPHT